MALHVSFPSRNHYVLKYLEAQVTGMLPNFMKQSTDERHSANASQALMSW